MQFYLFNNGANKKKKGQGNEQAGNEEKNSATRLEGKNHIHAGKSLLRALILASTNPQYYKRLFID